MPEQLLSRQTLILIPILSSLSFLVLYFWEYQKRRKAERESLRFKSVKMDEKSLHLLHNAFKKAQAILGKAELEGVKMVADTRVTNREMTEKYGERLFNKMDEAVSDFVRFLDEMRVKSEQTQLLSAKQTEARTAEIVAKFETGLAKTLNLMEQKGVGAIQTELTATKQLIEAYKTKRLTQLDESIVAILEETIATVMAKNIPLKEQADLIFEALEKAKQDKLIG